MSTVAESGSSLTGSYIRALLPKRGAGRSPRPALEAERDGVRVDVDHLRGYRRLCGFTAETALPPTYPHLTAFPMSMALLTGKDFPLRILGLVHIRNEITQSRPIHQAEPLDYRVWVEEPYEHPKGIAFDIGAQVRDTTEELVWSSTSTCLRRDARGSEPGSRPSPAADTASAADSAGAAAPGDAPTNGSAVIWRLPADLGRRYAAVSGDRNPIHLYPWSARMFGFKRQIVHGMWSAARCLAAVDAVPGAQEHDPFPGPGLGFVVDFRAPVILPSTVALSSTPDGDAATDFTLASPSSGRTHLVGRVGPVPV